MEHRTGRSDGNPAANLARPASWKPHSLSRGERRTCAIACQRPVAWARSGLRPSLPHQESGQAASCGLTVPLAASLPRRRPASREVDSSLASPVNSPRKSSQATCLPGTPLAGRLQPAAAARLLAAGHPGQQQAGPSLARRAASRPALHGRRGLRPPASRPPPLPPAARSPHMASSTWRASASRADSFSRRFWVKKLAQPHIHRPPSTPGELPRRPTTPPTCNIFASALYFRFRPSPPPASIPPAVAPALDDRNDVPPLLADPFLCIGCAGICAAFVATPRISRVLRPGFDSRRLHWV